MYVKLDPEIISIVCCPLCKGSLMAMNKKFFCKNCATEYPSIEEIFDFRINEPDYCLSGESVKWSNMQVEYEKYYSERSKRDDLDEYLNEIDSVKEIYNNEFDINGKVLDIGGGQGTTRYFLQPDKVSLYISVDPFINIFQNLQFQLNLLKAYPCLAEPCNFLACRAENLPFIANIFDWIQMRSVLDHFQDPYLALKEAYRVLKPGGILLIGLTVYGGKSSLKTENQDIILRGFISKVIRKIQEAGLSGLIKASIRKLFNRKKYSDPHIFHWEYKNLIDLLNINKFTIVKEHWQKPPFTMCVYIGAKKSI